MRYARAILGVTLLVLAVLPVYRLLDPAETGFAGEVTIFISDIHSEFLWTGLLLLAPFALTGALLGWTRVAAVFRSAGARLARMELHWFAPLVAGASVLAGIAFSLLVLEGRPNQIDSLAQLLHARYWAEGRLAGPDNADGEFWMIQNSLFTDRGWVSQYPPGHVAVLALFLKVGVPWLAGPMLMGMTVLCMCLVIHRLVPRAPAARLLSLLPVASPFFIALGASFMNHVTAAAFGALAAYGLVRAWQDRAPVWAIVAGAAFGVALLTRPFSTVAVGAALAIAIPLSRAPRPKLVDHLRMDALVGVGMLPFIALLLLYNGHFFGHPLVFGYNITLGPAMSLGFHRDPWGNLYGLREAFALTSADLMALGVNLLESPLSAVAVVSVFLILAPRLNAAERVVGAWAIAPIATNFIYWHHGLFMGPRMLHEVAVPWAVLFGLAAWRLASLLPDSIATRGWSPRAGFVTATAVAVLMGATWLGPQRLSTYGGARLDVSRVPVPALADPSLVFVHDAWTARIMSTLATHGYRLDVIETLIRQNATCPLHELAVAARTRDQAGQAVQLAALDTVPRASNLPPVRETAPGNTMRAWPGDSLSLECLEHVNSDTAGILDLAPLLWLGDLPGGVARGAMFVRDHGPEHNRRLLERYPDRQPFVYLIPHSRATTPVLVPYDEGMTRRWGAPDLAPEANGEYDDARSTAEGVNG